MLKNGLAGASLHCDKTLVAYNLHIIHHLVGVKAFMDSTVSLLVEVPEVLHESLRNYLEMRPDWDQDRVFTAALSLFLLQNRGLDSSPEKLHQRQASRIYLDTMFKRPVGHNN